MRWICGALLVAACERAAPLDDVVVALPPHVGLVMLEPGREPRVLLRRPLDRGLVHLEIDAVQRFGGEAPRQLREAFTDEALSAQDGVLHARQIVHSISVEPPPADFDPATLVGTSTETWSDARGRRLGPALVRTHAGSHGAQRVEFAVIEPEPAVGPGARWREEIDDGAVHATTTIELVSREGTHVVERATYHREDPTTKIPLAVDGTATVEFELGKPGVMLHAESAIRPLQPNAPVAGTETLELRVMR